MNKRYNFSKKAVCAATAILALSLFVVLSCSRNSSGSTGAVGNNASLAVQNDQATTSITSIASMAPSITSILCELGLGDFIVAADTWSEGIEGLGIDCLFFDILNPDVERLASLEIGVLFVSTMTQEGTSKDPFKPLADSGTKVFYIPTSESIAAIKQDILFIAEQVDQLDAGTNLVLEMESQIAFLQERVRSFRASTSNSESLPTTVFFEISPAPYLYSFGSGVFLNELIELAGLRNILKDQDGWLAVNAEHIVAKNPDIIFSNVTYAGDPVPEILSRLGWENIAAVQHKRVFAIDNNASSQPAHTIVKALQEMVDAVYGM